MKKILAEISLGELADKITILEIKMKKIIDKESLNILKKEYQSLKAIELKDLDLDKYEVKKDSLNIYEDDNRLGKPTAVSETSIDESALSSDWTKFATEDSE